jgi:hypothetical protein
MEEHGKRLRRRKTDGEAWLSNHPLKVETF